MNEWINDDDEKAIKSLVKGILRPGNEIQISLCILKQTPARYTKKKFT